MLQPEILSKEQAIIPVFRLAFRPFFLLPAIFSIVAVVLWLLVLKGEFSWQSALVAKVWHGHEMIFGFSAAIAVGFLLTAAQTWTGVRSINGWSLALMTSTWLVARILFAVGDSSLFIAAVGMQMLWWLISVGYFGYMIIKANNKRNLILVLLLSVMMGLNLAVLVMAGIDQPHYATHMLYAAVIAMTVVITVLAGRVVPFFTLKALNLSRLPSKPWLEKTLLITMLICLVLYMLTPLALPEILTASCFVVAGVLQLIRLVGWQKLAIYKVPLLWSLHLSYLNLAIGLIVVGISYLTPKLQFSDAIHIITLGAIGTMILAMMSRVSLGHTGRTLKVNRLISFAFILMLVTTWIRLILPLIGWSMTGYIYAVIGWAIAFGLFVYFYTPILLTARPDGRSG